MNPYPPGWTELPAAGLWAHPFRTPRAEAAFWKHLYESFEHVALIRTAANEGDETILVVIAPADFVLEAQAILDDVRAYGSPPVSPAPLPDACREDWFLAEWAKP